MAKETRHPDVLVLGAGLAGLNAALELEAAGLRVQVLEAQDRVGGRVYSMSGPSGDNGLGGREAGATYIGAGYARTRALVKRFGLELIDATPMVTFFREQALVLDGEIIPRRAWPSHPANPFPEPDRGLMPWTFHRVLSERDNPLSAPAEWLEPESAPYDVSVRAWLRGLGFSPAAIRIGYDLNPGFGDHAGEVSALMLFFRAAFSRAQRTAAGGVRGYTVHGGVARLPQAMATALGDRVQLNTSVQVVRELGAGRLQVDCADGSAYRAGKVVCALPAPVLRKIEFDPPLPAPQAAALERLRSQPVTQLYLAAKSRFWEQDGHPPSLFTDGLAGMLAAARDADNPDEVTGFTAWSMGPVATDLDRLAAEQAGRRVIQAIEAVRPAARGQLEFVGLKSWGRDPHAGGAWAYFRPGRVADAALIGKPHRGVFFAGEHLARSSRGMEGALESGERAAQALLVP